MKSSFRRLKLTNFRSVDAPLGERVFVVGPNAAGKTNLLDALRFLHDIARQGGGLAGALEARGDLAHLRSLHARRESHVCVSVELDVGGDGWSYELELARAPATMRRRLIAAPGAATAVGPLYEATLIEFGERFWDVGRACQRSPSLRRARASLRELAREWQKFVEGGG